MRLSGQTRKAKYSMEGTMVRAATGTKQRCVTRHALVLQEPFDPAAHRQHSSDGSIRATATHTMLRRSSLALHRSALRHELDSVPSAAFASRSLQRSSLLH